MFNCITTLSYRNTWSIIALEFRKFQALSIIYVKWININCTIINYNTRRISVKTNIHIKKVNTFIAIKTAYIILFIGWDKLTNNSQMLMH
jgi:hypothetical protein